MNEQFVTDVLNSFSIIGIVVFAISGALTAAEKKMDIIGFILIGSVTALGGGTLRDLFLGISPVSWVQSPFNITLCIIASSLAYFTVNLFQNRMRLMLWMDAVGLAAFAVLGTQIALSHDVSAIIAIVMGVMSATFGGVIRDVLCVETLTLMRPEMYITCALLAASVYVFLMAVGVGQNMSALIAFLTGFVLRGMAMVYKLKLPQFG